MSHQMNASKFHRWAQCNANLGHSRGKIDLVLKEFELAGAMVQDLKVQKGQTMDLIGPKPEEISSFNQTVHDDIMTSRCVFPLLLTASTWIM